MDKYINKAETVNTVNILIRKQREENYFDSVYDALTYLKGLLWQMDSVEVTRCEDCKHYVWDEFDGCYCCIKLGRFVKQDFQCAYGERKRQ